MDDEYIEKKVRLLIAIMGSLEKSCQVNSFPLATECQLGEWVLNLQADSVGVFP